MDDPQYLPPPPYTATYQQSTQLRIIHQVQHPLGIQQCMDQEGRQVESSFHHQQRAI